VCANSISPVLGCWCYLTERGHLSQATIHVSDASGDVFLQESFPR
jgi:hypothetical protein